MAVGLIAWCCSSLPCSAGLCLAAPGIVTTVGKWLPFWELQNLLSLRSLRSPCYSLWLVEKAEDSHKLIWHHKSVWIKLTTLQRYKVLGHLEVPNFQAYFRSFMLCLLSVLSLSMFCFLFFPAQLGVPSKRRWSVLWYCNILLIKIFNWKL